MIDVIIGCLLGVLGGAVMSPLLHKWLTKKLTKQVSLSKDSFIRIKLTNGLYMTIWDSYTDTGCICVCIHHGNKTGIADGDIVYFKGVSVFKVRGKGYAYDK